MRCNRRNCRINIDIYEIGLGIGASAAILFFAHISLPIMKGSIILLKEVIMGTAILIIIFLMVAMHLRDKK